MNRHAALASMCIGVSTFIVLTELVRLEVIILPVFLDPLMTSFFVAIVVLVTVGLLTQPSEEEMSYFRQIKNSSASSKTIAAILAKPDGLAELKREHRRVQMIMGVLVVLALASYGFMTLKLAF